MPDAFELYCCLATAAVTFFAGALVGGRQADAAWALRARGCTAYFCRGRSYAVLEESEFVHGWVRRAHLDAAVADAVAAERERCARVIEIGLFPHPGTPGALYTREAAAAAAAVRRDPT